MIRAGVGCSLNGDSKQAAQEAALQALERGDLKQVDWAIAFCTFHHRGNYKEILKLLCDVLQTANVVGCSSYGVITNSEEIEGDPGIAVLAVHSDNVRASPFLVHHTDDGGVKAGVNIGNQLIPTRGKNALLTVLSDPFYVYPELLFRGVESQLGEIPIVGAAASEHPTARETYQFLGDRVETGAVAGLMIEGAFAHRIGITQGCQPVGEPCVITKAEKNVMFELDGEPAFQVLKKQVPKGLLEDMQGLMYLLFIGFPPDLSESEIVGGEYLVRNLLGFDPASGAVAVAHQVREGQVITFTMRNSEMAREDLNQMLHRLASLKESDKPFKFGFYFNCLGRGSSLYGYQGIDTAYINHVLGEIPVIGFCGNSEFAPLRGTNYLFTYTGVLVLISE
ncbi:MAG TPA: FIST N-terminal domain-containing protein [Thermodesulfobacteriota bacterium]|nr:FIST N-terminal domain-containing protein [Thermodesulfobacteriota bacterium]